MSYEKVDCRAVLQSSANCFGGFTPSLSKSKGMTMGNFKIADRRASVLPSWSCKVACVGRQITEMRVETRSTFFCPASTCQRAHALAKAIPGKASSRNCWFSSTSPGGGGANSDLDDTSRNSRNHVYCFAFGARKSRL